MREDGFLNDQRGQPHTAMLVINLELSAEVSKGRL